MFRKCFIAMQFVRARIALVLFREKALLFINKLINVIANFVGGI
jgi:hypothetical protein